MTHLPKGQLIGIVSPDTIYPISIGTNPFGYTNLGVISAGNINVIISLGNGIALAGTSDGHIFRSTDYGNNWFDEGAVSASSVNTFSYIGNGIVIFGNSGAQIRRSTDFGVTWSVALFTSGAAIFSSAYLGGGAVLAGTGSFGLPLRGHIIQSADYGATWADVAGGITVGGTDAGFIDSITFIDSFAGSIVIFTDSNGRVFGSTNGGSNWTTVVNVSVGIALLVSIYIGNNVVIAVNNNGAIFRSNDKGVTWSAATLLVLPITAPKAIIYLGSGVIAYGGANNFINGSNDFGLTWSNFAVSDLINVTALCYLGNGVVVAGSSNGHISRSDIAFKTDEAQVNFPRIPVDQTASRLINTVYTNNDQTRSLLLMIWLRCDIGAGNGTATFNFEIPNGTVYGNFIGAVSDVGGPTNFSIRTFVTAVVKPGSTYKLVSIVTGTGVAILENWFETYI